MAKKLHILVVDDDKIYAALVQAYLDKYAVTSDVAESNYSAQQKFAEAHYDAVIVDWNLPDGTGGEFAASIRAETSNIPIIFISGIGSDFIVEETKKYSRFPLLKKADFPAAEIHEFLFSTEI